MKDQLCTAIRVAYVPPQPEILSRSQQKMRERFYDFMDRKLAPGIVPILLPEAEFDHGVRYRRVR